MDLCFNQKPKLPLILQDEQAECGHACVGMISQYYGHHLDLYSLRTLRHTSAKGVTLLDLTNLLEQLGFITRALNVPLDEINLIKCPAILHWNMNHFVVLKRVRKTTVEIHDPAVGARRCSINDFSRSFTGVVLEIEPSQDFKALKNEHPLSLWGLMKTVHGINQSLIFLLLVSLSIEMLGLLNPIFLQYVTDDVVGFNERNNLYVIALGFLILACIQGFIVFVRGAMVIYFTNHLTEKFSSNVVKHLLKLPLEFFEKRHKGDLQLKCQAIDQIQNKLSTDFVNTLLDGFMICLNLLVMMIYSPFLLGFVSVALVINVGIRYFSYQHVKKATASSIHQQAKATTVFLETLHAIVSIKSFLKETVRFNAWRNSYIDSLNAGIKISKMNLIYKVMSQILSQAEHVIVVSIGASLVLSHQLSVGMLLAFLSYRLILVSKATSFIQHLMDYKLVSIQLTRLSDILFQHQEQIGVGRVKLEQMSGALTLRNLSYRYNRSDRFVFSHLSLSIRAGEKVAIVGPSGCGKSTLLKVMMGLLEKTEGHIDMDGVSIQDMGLKNYRDLIAAVMQEDSLLSGSIMDNIAFFDACIDLAQVYRVAKLACIHDVIMAFPMGYETYVGDMGSLLSGGQKQRILIARALYKKPKILFLDEATSHLDGENEKQINDALKQLDITQVIVAHRKETIQMADRVIYLGRD